MYLAILQVEHVIREQNFMAANEIIELFCELIVTRLPIIAKQKFVLRNPWLNKLFILITKRSPNLLLPLCHPFIQGMSSRLERRHLQFDICSSKVLRAP